MNELRQTILACTCQLLIADKCLILFYNTSNSFSSFLRGGGLIKLNQIDTGQILPQPNQQPKTT